MGFERGGMGDMIQNQTSTDFRFQEVGISSSDSWNFSGKLHFEDVCAIFWPLLIQRICTIEALVLLFHLNSLFI